MELPLTLISIAGITVLMLVARSAPAEIGLLRLVALAATVAAGAAVINLRPGNEASQVRKGMAVYLSLAALSFWVWPGRLGKWMAIYPAGALYGGFFLMVVGPPLLGREVFSMYFAGKGTPPAVWETDVFKTINTI